MGSNVKSYIIERFKTLILFSLENLCVEIDNSITYLEHEKMV